MRKGIMRYNGKRYAQRDGKRTGGILDKARKPLDGYYQRIRGGVFLYSMDMEMFAFISTHGKQFVVDASMVDGAVKCGTTASEGTLERLGFASAVFGEERDAIAGITFS